MDSDDVTPANRDAEDEIIAPTKIPDDEQKRQMFSKSVEIMILAGMENHVYTFGNEIKKQKDGGPIGLSLTGEIADCFGINLILYQRFKDDITIVTEELDKGSKLENGRIIIDENKHNMDMDKHGDEITMEIIVEIAESVDDIVKFTADMPSKHKSNKIAILDVEVNINKKEQNWIDYEFYEKPSKNKRVILEDAALPAPQKRTILTQECLRRLRNTKIELGKETQVKHLNNFMLTMKNSGYPVKYRTEILNSSLKAFNEIIEADRSGIKTPI